MAPSGRWSSSFGDRTIAGIAVAIGVRFNRTLGFRRAIRDKIIIRRFRPFVPRPFKSCKTKAM
jgi:hypothetical protein